MASRKIYTCFVCQKAGHDVQVFLDGKDEAGHTKYLNEDMTRHTHLGSSSSSSNSSSSQQSKQKTEYERSVDNGISAFSMMSDLTILVEQTQKLLVTMDGKLDHLTKLVYSQQQQQPKT